MDFGKKRAREEVRYDRRMENRKGRKERKENGSIGRKGEEQGRITGWMEGHKQGREKGGQKKGNVVKYRKNGGRKERGNEDRIKGRKEKRKERE